MNAQTLNLLPAQFTARQHSGRLLLLLAALLLAVGAAGFKGWQQGQQQQALRQQIAMLQAQPLKPAPTANPSSPLAASGSAQRSQQWLLALAAQPGGQLAIQHLQISQDGNSLSVSGEALSASAAQHWLTALRSSPGLPSSEVRYMRLGSGSPVHAEISLGASP